MSVHRPKKPSVYGTAQDMGFALVTAEAGWSQIGIYLRGLIGPEPPPAKRGRFKKSLIEQGFPSYDIKAILEKPGKYIKYHPSIN